MKFSKKLYSTKLYKEWRTKVFERDLFTCRLCLKSNCYIEGHHILKKSQFPNLVFTHSNGITLCGEGRWSCHKRVTGKELKWAPLFQKILKENIWDPATIANLVLEVNADSKALIKTISSRKKPKKPKKYKRKVRRIYVKSSLHGNS